MRRLAGHRATLLYALLVLVCYGQVVWWFIFQLARSREVERLQLELLALRPTLESVTARGDAADALRARTRHRTRMFVAEGTFFLAVITVGTGMIHLAHRRERRLRRRQDELLKTVSHEFNTPLQSLRLSLETMMARDLPPERRERYVGRMTEDVDRLAGMVEQLLELQRLESATPEPAERCGLAEAVAMAVGGLEPRLRAVGLAVRVDARGPAEVMGRPADLALVVSLLLQNALKYAADGGRVEVAYGPGEPGRVCLTVTDAGPGLTRDDLRQLFTRFGRGSAARRGTVPGFGLGLAIARRIVTEHGGEIAASSPGPGQGARFEIVLPAAPAAPPAPEAPAGAAEEGRAP